MGIEPTLSAWEAEVLPLNYTRLCLRIVIARLPRSKTEARTGNAPPARGCTGKPAASDGLSPHPRLSIANPRMDIQVNGEARKVQDDATLGILLSYLGLTGRFAVEINGEIVPRGQHSGYHLRDGDHVEIVRAIGGG